MGKRIRLDAELVRRGLARSRQHAAELVSAGRVSVAGRPAIKPATQVALAEPIKVTDEPEGPRFASRGGHKLDAALTIFCSAGLRVTGRRCLDAGASTGGFTDVLLRRGAAHVAAVDVGYGQLAWSLRTDPRVSVHDRTNVRDIDADTIGGPVDLVTADLSFISLRLVLPALAGVLAPDADLVPMVKPQFEVGRDRLGHGGVVREKVLRADAVLQVASCAWGLGLGMAGVTASPLPGPSGNVEFFLWLRHGAAQPDPGLIERAVAEGPQ